MKWLLWILLYQARLIIYYYNPTAVIIYHQLFVNDNKFRLNADTEQCTTAYKDSLNPNNFGFVAPTFYMVFR